MRVPVMILVLAIVLSFLGCEPGRNVAITNGLDETIVVQSTDGRSFELLPHEELEIAATRQYGLGGAHDVEVAGSVRGQIPDYTWDELAQRDFTILIDEEFLSLSE